MPESKSREELLKEYRELQLRVTRFSATEQELINTRDRLDHELELYKRLYKYNALALKAKSYEDFYHLLCEAVVDVFEVESSFIFLQENQSNAGAFLYTEGLKFENSIHEIANEIASVKLQFQDNINHILSEDFLSRQAIFSKFSRGFFGSITDEKMSFSVSVFGMVSKSNERLYNQINERQLTLFGVFLQQLNALVSNRRKNDQIAAQINKIVESENEMRKLSLIATKTKSGVIITDTFGRIEWVNEAFQHISGYQLDEVKDLKPKDFLQGADSEDESRQKLRQALSNKEDVEVTIVNYNKEGKPYYNNLEIISVFNEKGEHTHFIALQKDITNEILFKQELVKVNSRFELIANQSKIGIWEFDNNSNSVVWSDVLFGIYGLPHTESSSALQESWKDAIVEEDRSRVLSSLDELKEGIIDSIDWEFKIVRQNDKAVRTLKSLTVAQKNDKGEIIRLVGSSQDITELKNAQEVMAQNNIELKKINSELDNFVYSISHDLRSPLLSIKGIISLIIHSDSLDANTVQLLEMADKSVSRLDGTIQEILEYSRNSRLNVSYESFGLKEMVSTIFEDLKFSNKEPFEFELIFESNEVLYSDKARVGILLKNIIGNSVKYKREHVVSQIIFKMFRLNGKVTLVVKDNGEGISEANKDKIFNMFFRGTTASVGTGLGLYICKEIVAKLGGAISVDSQLGVGTTMTIILPELNPS
jgi:PAS domain S-box-containing protein